MFFVRYIVGSTVTDQNTEMATPHYCRRRRRCRFLSFPPRPRATGVVCAHAHTCTPHTPVSYTQPRYGAQHHSASRHAIRILTIPHCPRPTAVFVSSFPLFDHFSVHYIFLSFHDHPIFFFMLHPVYYTTSSRTIVTSNETRRLLARSENIPLSPR